MININFNFDKKGFKNRKDILIYLLILIFCFLVILFYFKKYDKY